MTKYKFKKELLDQLPERMQHSRGLNDELAVWYKVKKKSDKFAPVGVNKDKTKL